MKTISCFWFAAVLVMFGCSSNQAPSAPPTVTEIPSPAWAGSEEPNLSGAQDEPSVKVAAFDLGK